ERRESVRGIAAGEEELEAVREERVCIVHARQRADFGRIRIYERRVEEGVLGELLEQLDLQLAGAVARLEADAVLRAQLAQIRDVTRSREVDSARHVLRDRVDDTDARERL